MAGQDLIFSLRYFSSAFPFYFYLGIVSAARRLLREPTDIISGRGAWCEAESASVSLPLLLCLRLCSVNMY